MAETNNEETFAFQAEISQLMSLIINTFYSNKDIFLRELISNSSDALDKIRFQSLQNSSVLDSNSKMEIEIRLDKDNNVLEIIDSGIGMRKEDLISNLGTIAKSGTKAFMETLSESNDMSMIGQFGVGFYSAYLVADRVEVHSKHNEEDNVYKWESNAGGSFNISDSSEQIKRGTKIKLFIKEGDIEYLEENRIRDIIKKHSEYINYPILLETEKEREVECSSEEIEDEDNEKETESDNEDNSKEVDGVEEIESKLDEVKIEEKDETKESSKNVKIEKYTELEEVNKVRPLWMRNKDEITEDEYTKFYKSLCNDWDGYIGVKHFSMEGQISLKSILYVPKKSNNDMFSGDKKQKNIKLYVRRVFITDDCDELIPEYLNFIKGIVDSEDLPLNISREILQQSRIMRVIRKNIEKKCIELMEELSEDNDKYIAFYKNYSKNIKLGVYEDSNYKTRLLELLRYRTSSGENVSLKEYVGRMKETQNEIYYITGEDEYELLNSSFVEGVVKRGYEVVLMTEPIDEYCMQQLNEFDGKKMISITKEGFKLPDSDNEKNNENYDELCKKIKEILEDKVEKVVVSERLVDSPCCVLSSKFGWSANMERIMKSQALRDNEAMDYMVSKKILEINVDHVIIKEVNNKLTDETSSIKNLVELLYDSALLSSGFSLENPSVFSAKLNNIIKLGLGIDETSETTEDNADTTEDNADTTEDNADTTEATEDTTEATEDTTEDNADTTEDNADTTEDNAESNKVNWCAHEECLESIEGFDSKKDLEDHMNKNHD